MCRTPVVCVNHTLCTNNKLYLSKRQRKLFPKLAEGHVVCSKMPTTFWLRRKTFKDISLVSWGGANNKNVLVLRLWRGRVSSERKTPFLRKLKRKLSKRCVLMKTDGSQRRYTSSYCLRVDIFISQCTALCQIQWVVYFRSFSWEKRRCDVILNVA